MDTKKLRQKILDLAIRGKLVPQDPNDEPASVLLERIRAEKEQLIKEGKIKRSKQKTSGKPHYENVPFEIPESWEWTSIGELLVNRDSERIPLSSIVRDKQENKIYDYYGAAGVIDKVNQYIFSEPLLLVGEDGANLLSRNKDNAFIADGKYWVNNHAHVLDCFYKITLKYVAICINGSSLDKYITGSAQPKLSQDNLNKILVPLPPIEEQMRIIDAKTEWFSCVDNIETNIDDLNYYIQSAKSKILFLAIKGALGTQNHEDEPSKELLKRIKPGFTPCDTSHYKNIPTQWQVAPMNLLCKLTDGEKQEGIERVYLDVRYLRGKGDGVVMKSGKYIPENSTIILVDGENSGEIFTTPISGYQGSTFKLLNISNEMYKPFILYVIMSYQQQFRENKVGSAIPHLNKKLFTEINVLVPPFEEQKRIVDKINDVFDAIKLFLN